jgi:hypothetical protein
LRQKSALARKEQVPRHLVHGGSIGIVQQASGRGGAMRSAT